MTASQRRRRGFLAIPEDKRRREIFEPLSELWKKYASGLLEGLLLPPPYGGGGGDGSEAKIVAAEAEGERRMRATDLHGAEVRVDACSCPSSVGVTGVVVRDSARTLRLISSSRRCSSSSRRAGRGGGIGRGGGDGGDGGDGASDVKSNDYDPAADDVLVTVPKRGTLFSLELPSTSGVPPKNATATATGGVSGGVTEGVRDGSRPCRVTLRGDDLIRGGG